MPQKMWEKSQILSLQVIAAVSIAALLHAAYSAAQHRLYLRLTEQPFTALPAG